MENHHQTANAMMALKKHHPSDSVKKECIMESSNLEFKTIRPIDLNDEALKPGSKATPFSTFIWAITSGDIATAETQITDDIEWGMMCYNKMLKDICH